MQLLLLLQEYLHILVEECIPSWELTRSQLARESRRHSFQVSTPEYSINGERARQRAKGQVTQEARLMGVQSTLVKDVCIFFLDNAKPFKEKIDVISWKFNWS